MHKINSEDLNGVLDKVHQWPVTSNELADKAEDPEVREFFESIPRDTQFDSEAEVLSMADQIDDPNLTVDDSTTSGTTAIDYEDEF